MILLNQPYSFHDRQLDRERRHQAAQRAICCLLYCAGCVIIGITIGMLITSR